MVLEVVTASVTRNRSAHRWRPLTDNPRLQVSRQARNARCWNHTGHLCESEGVPPTRPARGPSTAWDDPPEFEPVPRGTQSP